MKFWTLGVASPRSSAGHAARAEQAGWYGMMVVDSQNLSGDSYVALTMAATSTSTLKLGPGVTNSVTRHAAVTAGAIASVHKVSNGRAVLGIGRGDSALAHLGRAPATLRSFEQYLKNVQTYLAGGEVPFADCAIDDAIAPPVDALELAGSPAQSGINWLARDTLDKVPVEVAATGPRVIGAAARHADRIMLTVGAGTERVQWGIDTARAAASKAGRDPDTLRFGAYVNLACHPDLDIARGLARGGTSLFARFSVMHGDINGPVSAGEASVLNDIHDRYNMNDHGKADGAQTRAITADFTDGFAIVGPPDHCIERLSALEALGIDTVAISGPGATARSPDAKTAGALFEREILAVM